MGPVGEEDSDLPGGCKDELLFCLGGMNELK